MGNSQKGQSLVEALIVSLCLLPFLICFFQLMLFFGYQHLSNFLAHEALICIQEQDLLGLQKNCTQRLERTLKGIFIWTKEHRVQTRALSVFGERTSTLELQWTLGWIRYHKKFQL